MKTNKHYWILYLISATILITIAVQLYWNYKNYEQNKQRIINEIQWSLDNTIEQYYADLSKKNYLTIIKAKDTKRKNNLTSIKIDLDESKNKNVKKITDSLFFFSKDVIDKLEGKVEKITVAKFSKNNKKNNAINELLKINKGTQPYSIKTKKKHKNNKTQIIFTQLLKDKKSGFHFQNDTVNKVKFFKGKKAADSLRMIKGLSTILISMYKDSLDYKKADSILKKELTTKNIFVKYYIKHLKKDKLIYSNKTEDFSLKATAKSTFLKPKEKFQLFYENPTKEALKLSFTGILVSLLLSLAVISSLFYLLKVITQQKQLAEIKNDLISNITHEFKTPITTVSTALEAMNDFNIIANKEKAKNYISISENQIKKLHLMVEKLLETATLDSEKLLLKKEKTNVVSLLEKLIQKYLFTTNKTITFNCLITEFYAEIDVFHFENAISNLIDNAVKYGGNKIEINVSSEKNTVKIEVIDNGKGIAKHQQNKIFDKFYRIPKGNTHNVKGFGIGLYYTKKIIEKHRGSVCVFSNSKQTVFTVVV